MFKIRMLFSNGEDLDIEDEEYETEEEAREQAAYYSSCYKLGGEILNMSNPGDYPEDDEDPDYEIYED